MDIINRNGQQMFAEAISNNSQNMDESNYPNGTCNGNTLQLDMETEHSEGSDPCSSPSESPFGGMPDTPDVDADNENNHQLSSLSSDCMDPCSSPIQEGDTPTSHETLLEMDRSELIMIEQYIICIRYTTGQTCINRLMQNTAFQPFIYA